MTEPPPDIRHYEAADGYRLYYRHWRPEGDPAGRVVYLHGIQSHGGWFLESCRRLRRAGMEVLFAERRGSGLNQAQRGDAPDAAMLIEDVRRLLEQARTAEPRRPVLLVGLSWGGKLAAVVAARHPGYVDGLALLYPGLSAHFEPTRLQRGLIRLARALGGGGLRVAIPLDDAALFTLAPRWRDYIAADPLALRRVTVRLLAASIELDTMLPHAAGRLTMPVLLMLAGRDEIVDNAAVRAYFERLASRDKRLIEYPDAQHTLEFEPDPEPFFRDLVAWCRAACEKSPRTAAAEHARSG